MEGLESGSACGYIPKLLLQDVVKTPFHLPSPADTQPLPGLIVCLIPSEAHLLVVLFVLPTKSHRLALWMWGVWGDDRGVTPSFYPQSPWPSKGCPIPVVTNDLPSGREQEKAVCHMKPHLQAPGTHREGGALCAEPSAQQAMQDQPLVVPLGSCLNPIVCTALGLHLGRGTQCQF